LTQVYLLPFEHSAEVPLQLPDGATLTVGLAPDVTDTVGLFVIVGFLVLYIALEFIALMMENKGGSYSS